MTVETNVRPEYDLELQQIADYVLDYEIESSEAWTTARYCLMDALGCAMLGLKVPECARLLGPYVKGTKVPNGSRVPGTDYRLDPVKAAWDIGTMIRWLDFNDTWLAAEWGHPSDNLGGILAVADRIEQRLAFALAVFDVFTRSRIRLHYLDRRDAALAVGSRDQPLRNYVAEGLGETGADDPFFVLWINSDYAFYRLLCVYIVQR